jgi:hypothetical protein
MTDLRLGATSFSPSNKFSAYNKRNALIDRDWLRHKPSDCAPNIRAGSRVATCRLSGELRKLYIVSYQQHQQTTYVRHKNPILTLPSISLRFALILSSHLLLGLFQSGVETKIIRVFPISPNVLYAQLPH